MQKITNHLKNQVTQTFALQYNLSKILLKKYHFKL